VEIVNRFCDNPENNERCTNSVEDLVRKIRQMIIANRIDDIADADVPDAEADLKRDIAADLWNIIKEAGEADASYLVGALNPDAVPDESADNISSAVGLIASIVGVIAFAIVM
jgi:hypothetical protein